MSAQEHATSSPRQTALQVVATVTMLAAFFGLYFVAGHVDGTAISTHSRLDDHWPFVPATVWIYLSPYPLGLVLVALLPPPLFRAFYVRGLLLGALQTACFFAVPTMVERPALPLVDDGASLALLRALYAFDSPLNAAPSAHVSITLLATWTTMRAFAAWRAPAALWCTGVVVSVLLTGQHHVFDVVTGAALFALVHLVVSLRERARAAREGATVLASGDGLR